MIVKSSFRQRGGLEAHLLRNDTNEAVIIRDGLFRGAASLHDALRLMDGIARTNSRTKRSFIHVVIAPDQALDEDRLATSLAVVEAEFNIAADAPRAVVQHAKGERPDHFHVVYSVVDLATGAAIKSQGNFETDELISRRLEIEFGSTITPGPRIAENIDTLQQRGLHEAAAKLREAGDAPVGKRIPRDERRQLERLGIGAESFSQQVYRIYEAAKRDLQTFARLAEDAGLALCRGHTVVLVIDDKTGADMPLARCLRREAKAAGRPLTITEHEIVAAFPNLADKAAERDVGLGRAKDRAEHNLSREWSRARYEAMADADQPELVDILRRKKQAKDDADREQAEVRETLRARREDILAIYRRRDDVRRRRVDRAFRIARITSNPALQELAFLLAATGVLMTGGGLTMAVVAGGMAMAVMQRRRPHARQIATAAGRQRTADARARRGELDAAYRTSRQERSKLRSAPRFRFEEVAKADRVLVGMVVVDALKRHSDEAGRAQAKKVIAHLRPDLKVVLDNVLTRGTPQQKERVCDWYLKVAEDKRDKAVEAALRAHRSRTKTGAVDHKTDEARKKANPPKRTTRTSTRIGKPKAVRSRGREI